MPDPITMAAIIGGGISLGQYIHGTFRQNSAHQREVKDLVRAGVNPIHSAGGQGAPSQNPGPDVGHSAMQAARFKAEVELLKAQANREDATAVLARTQAADVSSSAAGRYDLTSAQADVARMNAAQIRAALPTLKERALEELKMTRSNAEAARIGAILRELEVTRARNLEKFERQIGELGPWARLFIEAMGKVR